MYKTNLKNQAKNKNETMNVLYHINGKNSSYKLNQTIKTFKTQKPQVKSSRADTSYLKKQSKSIQSQSKLGGQSHKSVRKVSQQTFSKNIQQSVQSRLKSIYNIFHLRDGKNNRKDVQQILIDSHNKFDEFFGFIEQRKMRMIQDQLDNLLQGIVKNFQLMMGTLVERIIEQQTQKYLDMRLALQKIILGYQNQIKKLKQKNDQLFNDLGGQIQQLMAKSLVTTQTISYIHRQGVMNFQDWVKSALGICRYQQQYGNYEEKRPIQQDKIKKYIYYQK